MARAKDEKEMPEIDADGLLDFLECWCSPEWVVAEKSVGEDRTEEQLKLTPLLARAIENKEPWLIEHLLTIEDDFIFGSEEN